MSTTGFDRATEKNEKRSEATKHSDQQVTRALSQATKDSDQQATRALSSLLPGATFNGSCIINVTFNK